MESRSLAGLGSTLTAVASVIAVTAAGQAADANAATAGFLFLLVVLVASAWGGLVAGVAASLVAAVCFNLFLPPLGSFHVADPENWLALAAFMTTAVLVSRLVTRAREQAARAEAHASEVETLALERERLLRERVHVEALRESEELKTALLRAVSHDLSTPLTAIGFQVGALRRQLDGNLEALQTVDELEREASRLHRRIEDLLALGRLEAGSVVPRPEPVPPGDLFRSARESLSLLRRSFHVKVDADCPEIYADPSLALEIVVNLLENADRASGGDSAIELRAEGVNGNVRIGVLDRGRGLEGLPEGSMIDAGDVTPRGLGLEIAHRFAAASGGSVKLQARGGGGVAAWVLLPAAAEGAPS